MNRSAGPDLSMAWSGGQAAAGLTRTRDLRRLVSASKIVRPGR